MLTACRTRSTSACARNCPKKEISDLSFAIMSINGWNRLNVGFRTVPGSADKAYGLDKAKFN